MLEGTIRDLGYALRTLSKRPILLVTTTLSIGLGVGINVAVYTALKTILFDTGQTAVAPEELFVLEPGLSHPNYLDVRESDAFADLAAMQASTLTYRTDDSTITISARVVSENFFEVLGLRPLLGRLFGSKDDRYTIRDLNVVVISYGFWQRLGGQPSVVGQPLYLNGRSYVIAGVLPDGVYSMIGPLVSPSVYVPIGPQVTRGMDVREAAQFDLVGRLRHGMSHEQLSAALVVVGRDLERRFPDVNDGLAAALKVAPLRGFVYRLPVTASRIAFTLASALYIIVGLVVLVTCANVGGLLLARAAERARETAVRIALGATRARLVRLSFAESFVVAMLGCIAGAGLWMAVSSALPKTAFLASAGVDLISSPLPLLQCGLLVVLVTLACGIGPVLTTKQLASGSALRAHHTGLGVKRWSMRQSLVATEVAVSFILLVGGCALLFSMLRQQLADPGFDLVHTVLIERRVPPTVNGPDFFALRDALGGVPGVESVSAGNLPVGLAGFERVRKVGAGESTDLTVQINRVGPSYLRTMGIRLLRGRDMRDGDIGANPSPTPVVVGETFARRYLGSLDVVGHQLQLPRDRESGREASRLEVVGVSSDGALQIFGGDPVPVMYVPALSASLVVRVAGSPAGAVRTLERTITALAPSAAVTVEPMTAALSQVLLPARVATIFLGALGALGLLLAVIGLYGTMSYAANSRRSEIALRIALGASSRAIVRMLMRDAVLIVCVGSIVGAALSFGLLRAIWPLLAGNQTTVAPLALVAVFALTLTVGLTSALRPALSAASVEPMLAMREE